MTPELPNLPEKKHALLQQLVDQLSRVPGMVAIVLGGSYASGTQHEGSDMDVGLYYSESSPFPIREIRRIAEEAAEGGRATVTEFYGWGQWVNGGAWIHASSGKVDFLYRNLEQIECTIEESKQGIFQHDYDQQPAYGFYSMIYLAETQICIPLYDPEGRIVELKRRVEPYPPRLKESLVSGWLWSAEFTLLHAQGFAEADDIYNTAGCLTRAASGLTQVLFALNEKYFMRDKKVMETMAGFKILPPGFIPEIGRILAHPGRDVPELTKSVRDLGEVWRSVVSLPGTHYQPKFQL